MDRKKLSMTTLKIFLPILLVKTTYFSISFTKRKFATKKHPCFSMPRPAWENATEYFNWCLWKAQGCSSLIRLPNMNLQRLWSLLIQQPTASTPFKIKEGLTRFWEQSSVVAIENQLKNVCVLGFKYSCYWTISTNGTNDNIISDCNSW